MTYCLIATLLAGANSHTEGAPACDRAACSICRYETAITRACSDRDYIEVSCNDASCRNGLQDDATFGHSRNSRNSNDRGAHILDEPNEEFRDPPFERYVDLRMIGDALAALDASLLADLALQLADGEHILLRHHASGLTAKKVMQKAAHLAAESRDDLTLQRLQKFAQARSDDSLISEIEAAKKLAGASRATDPALTVSLETADLDTLITVATWVETVRYAALTCGKDELERLQQGLHEDEALSSEQRQAIRKMIEQAVEQAADFDREDEVLLKLAASSRQVRYETNKWDWMRNVEAGGWVVAWADDISETDVLRGVVSAGVSVYSANPAVFITWVNNLIRRTIQSLMGSAGHRFPDAIRRQVESLAADAIRSAVQGRSAREVSRRYDTVDFKAGAIRYAGRNYVDIPNICTKCSGLGRYFRFPRFVRCGPCNGTGKTGSTKQTISNTWGLKPYVAFRWRGSR